jgi:hypothetical protein
MTYDEYKKHLEACGPLDDISKGLLSAFELGYGQGIKDGKTLFTKALAQPEQEPVGYVTNSGRSAWILKDVDLDDDTPLYTAPPKPEWIEDGFGTMWQKCGEKNCGRFVVKIGKVDCWNGDCPEEKNT